MPNTDDQPDWLQLLTSLTDDELRQYSEIANDQRRLEWRHGWAQLLCVVASLALLVWFGCECLLNGPSWRGASILGLAAAFGYWPYRKAIVRRLWRRHIKAVAREAADRRQAGNK
jgi:hypothetical protein